MTENRKKVTIILPNTGRETIDTQISLLIIITKLFGEVTMTEKISFKWYDKPVNGHEGLQSEKEVWLEFFERSSEENWLLRLEPELKKFFEDNAKVAKSIRFKRESVPTDMVGPLNLVAAYQEITD